MSKKQYVVRKFVEASSIREVLKKEKSTPPHEIFLKDEPEANLGQSLGFSAPTKV